MLSYFLSHDVDRSREITIIFMNYFSKHIHVTKRYNGWHGLPINTYMYINKVWGGVTNLHYICIKKESPENGQTLNQPYTVFGLLLYSMLVNGKKNTYVKV